MGKQFVRFHALRWVGDETSYINKPTVIRCGQMMVGCYGGNIAAGAKKNEDGALLWNSVDGSWEFAMLLDAHNSTQSAVLLLKTLEIEQQTILSLLSRPAHSLFPALHQHLISRFRSPAFRTRCRYTQGETSCLICVRKGKFLWWLSVGDCLLYILHPEFARQGQFKLNQRNHYEWIGQRNTFDLEVPCYSTGNRELRSGPNHIIMATDGLHRGKSRFFANPRNVYKIFWGEDLKTRLKTALYRVHRDLGDDNTTIIAWRYNNTSQAIPSTV